MALAHIERRAERMRERRDELGLTQEEVADRMQDIHRERHPDEEPDHTRGQMVSDWERAVNEPSAPKLELLAAALEWTVADLNTDQARKEPSSDPLDELATGPTAKAVADLQRKVDEILDGQAELLAVVSEVRDAQERLLRLQGPDTRGGEATGT